MHCYILNIEAVGRFREDFKFSPIISLWKLMTPKLDPRGMLGWIYVRDRKTNAKY